MTSSADSIRPRISRRPSVFDVALAAQLKDARSTFRCASCRGSRFRCRCRRTAAALLVSVAATTPGSACSRGAAAGRSAASPPPSYRCRAANGSRATRMLSGSSPRSTCCSSMKLRISRPAPTSSISESATLDDHERAAQPAAAESAADAFAGVLERLDDVRAAPSAAAGTSPNSERRDHGHRQAEQQHRHVQADDDSRGIIPSGMSGTTALDPAVREETAERGAAGGEQQALDRAVAESAARGWPRATPAPPSPSPGRRSRQQHVRDVDARDQQQQPDRRRQRVERVRNCPTMLSTQLTTLTVNFFG